MPFDPSTASPVDAEESKFDPSSAEIYEPKGFVASAKDAVKSAYDWATEKKPLLAEARPEQGGNFDPMLDRKFVDNFRAEIAKAPIENRLNALRAYAENDQTVYGRAAKVILAEEEYKNAKVTDAGKREAMSLLPTLKEPEPRAPGKVPAKAPSFPESNPNFVERFDGVTDKQVAGANDLAMGIESARSEGDLQVNRDRAAGELQTASRKQFANDSPTLGGLASGMAGQLQGLANSPAAASDWFNKVVINPILNVAGVDSLPRTSTAPGTESLSKMASDYAPDVTQLDPSDAWKKDKFGEWLVASLASNAPSMAMSLASAFAPAVRVILLPAMGAQSMGQSYAGGDDSRIAALKGASEIGTEMLPLSIFDKIRGLAPAVTKTILADVGSRLLASGAAITGQHLTEAIEEGVNQVVGNALDKYAAGKDIPLTKGVESAVVLGGISGGLLGAPHVASIATTSTLQSKQAEQALARELESGTFSSFDANLATLNPNLQKERDNTKPNPAILGAKSVDEAITAFTTPTNFTASPTEPRPGLIGSITNATAGPGFDARSVAGDYIDEQDLAELVKTEESDVNFRRAVIQREQSDAAESKVAQKLYEASQLEGPSALELALQEARQRQAPTTPEPAASTEAVSVSEPRIVPRTPYMTPMPKELAELQVDMDGGEVVRILNRNGKYAYAVIKDSNERTPTANAPDLGTSTPVPGDTVAGNPATGLGADVRPGNVAVRPTPTDVGEAPGLPGGVPESALTALFDEQGRKKFPQAESVRQFKIENGVGQDAVRLLQASVEDGKPITIEEAKSQEQEILKQRKSEFDAANSPEGKAKAQADEAAKAAKEQADRDALINGAHPDGIPAGQYVDVGTGLPFTVLPSGMITTDGNPYGTVAKGKTDQAGVGFAMQLKRGDIAPVDGTNSTPSQPVKPTYDYTQNKAGNVTVMGDPAEIRSTFAGLKGATFFADGKPAGVMFTVPDSPAVMEMIKPTLTDANRRLPTPAASTQPIGVTSSDALKQPWQMTRAEYAKQGGETQPPVELNTVQRSNLHTEVAPSREPSSLESNHRDAVEEAFKRGEQISPEVLQDYPWLAAREAIKQYVESLRNLSDKELKAESKKTENDLNSWANRTQSIVNGRLNPELGQQAGFEVSEKMHAVDREIEARKSAADVTPVSQQENPNGVKAEKAISQEPGQQAAPAVVSPLQAEIAQQRALSRSKAIEEAPAIVLQNRDRSSAASIAQMNEIASNPDYLRVGPSNVMDSGAPVVFGDIPKTALVGKTQPIADGKGQRTQIQYAVVEASDLIASHQADGTAVDLYSTGEPGKLRAVAGNGRTAGIIEGYNRGTANTYKQDLIADAQSIGLDSAAVSGMKSPVLVRVMDSKDITSDIGDRSNIASAARLSSVEQASTDAKRHKLDSLEFHEDGSPTQAAITQFVRSMPTSEQSELIGPDGTPTKQAVDRLMAATFKQAYGSDELVSLYAQAQDPEARTILSGLADAAGSMASLKDSGEHDIRGAIAEAAGFAVNARRQGIKLTDMLKTRDMMMSDEALVVAQFMADNVRSAKKISEGLRNVAEYAAEQAQIVRDNKDQGGMFGETPVASRYDIFRRLNGNKDIAPQSAQEDNLQRPAGAGEAQGIAQRPEAGPAQGDNARVPGVDSAVQPAQADQSKPALKASQAEIDEANSFKHKTNDLQRLFDSEKLNPTDPFHMHLLSVVLPTAREYDRLMTEHKGDLAGVEFESQRDGVPGKYAFVLPDASQPGKWRISYFDKNGFSSHHVEDTKDKAQQTLVSERYTKQASGVLDKLSATRDWERGMAVGDALMELNSRKITHRQFNDKVLAIDEAFKDVAVRSANAEARPQDLLGDKPNASQQAAADILAAREKKQKDALANAPAFEGLDMVDSRNGNMVAPGQQEIGAEGMPLQTAIRMSYKKAIAANMEHMGSELTEWTAVEVTGTEIAETDNGKRAMPSFKFPDGYKDAPSLFKSNAQTPNCELCGTPIKNAYWIQNDLHQWTMLVGSECVTHFGEGKSGEKLSKEAQQKVDRQLLKDAEQAKGALWKAFTRKASVGYGRHEMVWKDHEARKLWEKMQALIGPRMKAEKRYEQDYDASNDASVTRWANANRDEAADTIREARLRVEKTSGSAAAVATEKQPEASTPAEPAAEPKPADPVAAAVTALQGAVNDLAKAIAPKPADAPVSSVQGQKNLASRGSRIATLKMMNEQIRKLDPSEAWHDSNIDDSTDLDGLQDSISQTLVDLQRKAAPKEEAKAEQSAEQKIRAAFSALPSVSMGVSYPITVEHNGRVQHFLARQDALGKGANYAAVHLTQIKQGRLLAGDPLGQIVNKYKLDGKNVLQDEGFPHAANEAELKQWNDSGFDKPAQPAGKIEDFGEELKGGRKNQAPSLSQELTDEVLATQPLSKVWPADEYLAIDDKFASAVAFVARTSVPRKPNIPARVARWVESVKAVRSLAQMINDGRLSRERMAQELTKTRGMSQFADKVALLEAIDREQWPRIGSVEVFKNAYMYREDGTQFAKPLVRISIDDRIRNFDGASSIADVVERVSAMLDTEQQQSKRMQFEVRGTKERGYSINKKGDTEYRKLKTFETANEALAYVDKNYSDVVAAWEAVKARDNVHEDDVRNDENRPRTGADHRSELSKTRVIKALIDRAHADAKEFSNALIGGAATSHLSGNVNIPRSFGSQKLSFASDVVSPELRKRPSYMAAVNLQLLADIAKTPSISVQIRSEGNIPLVSAMQEAMISLGHNNEVAWAVIKRVPVDVVDFLSGKKIPTERLFSDKSVFKSLLSVDGGMPVRRNGDDPVVTLMREIAGGGAKIIDANDPSWVALESDSALITGQINSGIEKSLFSHDVSPEDFQTTLSFKGVEFGNWVSQGKNAKERQGMLNQAYDALLDLADIVGIPSKAISLNGSIGLSFGSRGHGAYAAHFEPENLVINLTKTRGAGSLAHEWLHALDNYFSRQRQGGESVSMKDSGNTQQGYRENNNITYKPEPLYVRKTGVSKPITKAKLDAYWKSSGDKGYYNPENWHIDPKHPQGVRPEVERKFAELVEALDASPMKKRADSSDKGVDGYWGRIIERAARSFENYVISKMLEKGYQNDYLANVKDVQDFQRDAGRYPYLLPEEVAPIAEAFDNLFGTIKTKETDKGTAMYEPQKPYGDQTATPEFRKWFGDSKVVDAQGNPLVVYHGTASDITEFRRTRSGEFGPAIYTTSDPAEAASYADGAGGHHLSQPPVNVMPLYVSLKNPFTLGVTVFWNRYNKNDGDAAAVQRAIADGFDGVIEKRVDYRGKESFTHYIAFNPTQIKSAIGNNGNFDGANPSIVKEPVEAYNNIRGQLDLFLDSEPDQSQAGARPDGMGKGIEAARRDAAIAVEDLHATGSVLARTLSSDLATKQRTNLVGQTVANHHDLAVLAQLYRDERFETFRVIFTDKNDKVVSQVGVTSRLPGSVEVVIGPDVGKYISDLSATAKQAGATSYSLLHNHPSGKATPSSNDEYLTKNFDTQFAMQGLAFKGHVVIDTNEYAVIDRRGISTIHQKDFGAVAPMLHSEFGSFKIAGPADIMQLAKKINVDTNGVTLVVTDHQYRVKAVTTLPSNSITSNHSTTRLNLLKAVMRSKGSMVLAVSRDEPLLRHLSGMIVDGVYVAKDGSMKSLASLGVIPSKGAFPESRRTRVSSDTSPEFNYLREASQRVNPYGAAKVSQPVKSLITGRTLPQTWQAPDASKMDDFIYSMQDKHVDTKRVMTAVRGAIGAIADQQDPYLQEELYHGRSAMAVKEFLEKQVRPLIMDLQARGVDMSDFEEYLHNRHAERRNVQVAKVNPAMQDGGSGIKTADARAYLAALPADKARAYTALAAKVDQINRDTRALLVSSGLEKQSTIDAWQAAYGDEYVPLMREEMENGMGIGQGFSVRGSASKRAMGSDKPVANILANIMLAREKAITRSEKRKIGEALYGLVLEAPNPNFWLAIDPALQQNPAQLLATSMQLIDMGMDPADAEAIAKEPTTRYVNPKTGLVESRINPAMRSAENVLAVRIDGEDKYVFFNKSDERAMRMAKALKNLDADQLGQVMGTVAKMTRYFAAVNTQFNPVFGVTNIIRDVQTAMLNLQSTALKGKQKDVLKNILPALRGIYIDLRDHRAGKQPTSAYAQVFEEFQREGGATGYRDMYANAEERADQIRSEIAAISDGKVMKLGKGVMGWLSDYNEAMENAVRVSAYMAAKEHGMSNQQAASLAKNLTVNFNRKGQVALQAGALYAFFNASVQGSARMGQTLFEGGKLSTVGKQIITGGLLLGAMQAMLLAAAGFDDDEPPDFVRERNIVIPIGGKKYITIPMPLGFHVIPNLARIPTEWAMGGFKNTPKRIGQLFGLLADGLNPIGSSTAIQTLSPTIIDPFVALSENKDWTGKPIAKKDFDSMHPTAGHTRAKDTATPWAKFLSKATNYATGGTEYKPGVLSPTPDQIDYVVGQLTGGVGREISKLAQVGGATIQGDEIPLYKIPLVGRFVGTTEGQAAESSRFYENLKSIGVHKAEIDGLKRDHKGGEIGVYVRDNPEARMLPMATKFQDEVSKLNHRKRELVKQGASAERIKIINMQITAKMAAFNNRVRQMEESAK